MANRLDLGRLVSRLVAEGRLRPPTNRPVVESRIPNVQRPPRPSAPTRTTDTELKEMLGIKPAAPRMTRANMDIGDISAQRSDRVPGMYTCIECNKAMPLQESWRKADSGVNANFSTLFCAECAQRLNRSHGSLNLAPIQLSNFDALNLGQFVPEFGVVGKPAAVESGLTKWQRLLGS